MLFIALSLLGYVSYKQLPVELLPNAELPVLFVQVSSQQDMDPSYVESEVIIPLEGAVSAIGGVDKLQSYIDRRQSSIQIDFKKNINFKMTSLKLQEKVNEIAASLPTGFTVQVQKVDIAQMNNNFMVLQVRGTGRNRPCPESGRRGCSFRSGEYRWGSFRQYLRRDGRKPLKCV